MPSLSDMVSASTQALVTLRKKTVDAASNSLQLGKSAAAAKRTSRASIISLQHYDNLVSELRCPSCASPMCAPIRLCKTGHSVCDLCARMLQRCPLCSKAFTDTRSIALEAVASKAEFSCANVALGCATRLPLRLLRDHEQRCVYQMGDCFMGRVWGKCEWRGREMDWLEHCEREHADRMFFEREVTIAWQGTYDPRPKPISAYYIFRALGESFNMYQLWDSRMQRISWTLICASKDATISKRFAYEVEVFVPTDPSRMMLKRQAVHGEQDEDVLVEGRGAAFDMKEVISYMDAYRVLHYRVRILQIPSQVPSPSTRRVAAISEAKKAFLADTPSSSAHPITEEPSNSSMTSSIVVAAADDDGSADGSSSSFEHMDAARDKTSKDLSVFEKEFPIAESSELRSPALLARFNSIPKPPRHSLDRTVTAADVAAMQPTLLADDTLLPNDDGPVPEPPTTPMPKDEKAVAFAKSNMN